MKWNLNSSLSSCSGSNHLSLSYAFHWEIGSVLGICKLERMSNANFTVNKSISIDYSYCDMQSAAYSLPQPFLWREYEK